MSQSPILAAMAAGVGDPGALVLIHSAGLVIVPNLFWFAAIWIQRGSPLFWVFVMMWATVCLTSGFFAVGEYNLTYALSALAASLLLPGDRVTPIRLVTVAVVAVVLLRSYESMLFLGPLLAAIAIRAALSSLGGNPELPTRVRGRVLALSGVALCFLAGAALALFSPSSLPTIPERSTPPCQAVV